MKVELKYFTDYVFVGKTRGNIIVVRLDPDIDRTNVIITTGKNSIYSFSYREAAGLLNGKYRYLVEL